MKPKTIITRFVLPVGSVCIIVAALLVLKHCMFAPVQYEDLQVALDYGLFQDIQIEKGSCTFEIPPSWQSFTMPLLHSVVNLYGQAELSEKTETEILKQYDWTEWTVSEDEWLHKTSKTHLCGYMYEFPNLKEKYVNRELLISDAFDQDHMRGKGMCVSYSYYDPSVHTLLFYYHSS